MDPVGICNQNGNFGVALAKHEKIEENMEKVQRWKAALNEVASLPGLHYNDEYVFNTLTCFKLLMVIIYY